MANDNQSKSVSDISAKEEINTHGSGEPSADNVEVSGKVAGYDDHGGDHGGDAPARAERAQKEANHAKSHHQHAKMDDVATISPAIAGYEHR